MSANSKNYAVVNSSLSISNIITQTKVTKKSILKKIYKLFNKKYSKLPESYDINIIDNIIYNEKSHIVATFKDCLISDDIGEFLKRFYKKNESAIRLPKFYEYYDLYSKIFPNYTAFEEGKYLYLNIQRKQRMIDLIEKMELEKKKNEEKSHSYGSDSESKENVFNTDVINSILNGTNNESINYLFDIDKNDALQDEEIFGKDVNDLLEEINKYEYKGNNNGTDNKIIKLNKNRNEKSNNIIIFNKAIKYNNQLDNNFNYYNKNKDINRIETYKDTVVNKNISIPINLNYSKNKRIINSNSSSTINNNITYYNDIRGIVTRFFNYPSYQKNIFLNEDNKTNKNYKIEKLEKNLFKIKQKSILFQKNSSQSISTSNQTQKDLSLSKKNANIIYAKIPVTSSSFKQNQKILRKNIYNSTSYNIHNSNITKYIEKRKKGITPLTSRNPKNSQLLNITRKNKSIKNIKGNTLYNSCSVSRNRYSNNIKVHNNKIKSTIIRNDFSQMSKINQSKTNISKPKKILNNQKNKISEEKPKRGYKEINFIRNQNPRNRNEIKEKILNSGFNFNKSRNNNVKSINKNNCQKKNEDNSKKWKNLNDSSLKLRIKDIMSVRQNIEQGFNIKNFAKIINAANSNNNKYNLSKTYKNNYVIMKK